MWYPKMMVIVSVLACLVIFFSRCFNHGLGNGDARGDQYAGTTTCISCHKNIYNSYTHNNHYRSSSAVNNDSLKKMILPGNARFFFTDSGFICMEEEQESVVQSYFVNNTKVISGKFDIAFGSGEKAQTFAYWKEDKLYQLPLTYFAGKKTWANSPGFPASHARFDRVIDSRCFQCHASYVDKTFEQSASLSVTEKLDKNTIVFGIDCERCHGPAMEHVKFQEEHPSVTTSRYVTSIKSLSRRQQLDVCAACHSGNDRTIQKSLFGFIPGDTLANFYYPDFGSGSKEPDVHGKQLQLLQSSKCFMSSDMTCTSCHGPHETGENEMTVFISKCMGCHQNSEHARNNLHAFEQPAGNGIVITGNCIDCHMPLQASKAIYFNNGAGLTTIPYFLRTHKVAVYK